MANRSSIVLRALVAAVIVAIRVASQAAPFVETDDAGRTLAFDRPAVRVITLAPSLTELVFAAGGGDAIVATDSSSDYPGAAAPSPGRARA